MNNNILLNSLSDTYSKIEEIIGHLENNHSISEIEKDILLDKLKNTYELLKKNPSDSMSANKEKPEPEIINSTENNIQEPHLVEEITATIEHKPALKDTPPKPKPEPEPKEKEIEVHEEIETNMESKKTYNNNDTQDENKTLIENETITEEASEPEYSDIETNDEHKPDEIISESLNKDTTDYDIQDKMIETETENKNEVHVEKIPEPDLFNLHREIPEVAKPETKKDTKSSEPVESIGEKYMNKDKKSLNDILAEIRQNKDLVTQLQYKKIDDLKSVISLNDKIRFIKELFEGVSSDYNKTITYINDCNDLDEAMNYINNNMKWNDDKDSFRQFLELIYRRHLPVNE